MRVSTAIRLVGDALIHQASTAQRDAHSSHLCLASLPLCLRRSRSMPPWSTEPQAMAACQHARERERHGRRHRGVDHARAGGDGRRQAGRADRGRFGRQGKWAARAQGNGAMHASVLVVVTVAASPRFVVASSELWRLMAGAGNIQRLRRGLPAASARACMHGVATPVLSPGLL